MFYAEDRKRLRDAMEGRASKKSGSDLISRVPRYYWHEPSLLQFWPDGLATRLGTLPTDSQIVAGVAGSPFAEHQLELWSMDSTELCFASAIMASEQKDATGRRQPVRDEYSILLSTDRTRS